MLEGERRCTCKVNTSMGQSLFYLQKNREREIPESSSFHLLSLPYSSFSNCFHSFPFFLHSVRLTRICDAYSLVSGRALGALYSLFSIRIVTTIVISSACSTHGYSATFAVLLSRICFRRVYIRATAVPL